MAVSTIVQGREENFIRQEANDAQELTNARASDVWYPRAVRTLDCATGPIILTEHERVLLRRVIDGAFSEKEERAPLTDLIGDLAAVMALRPDSEGRH